MRLTVFRFSTPDGVLLELFEIDVDSMPPELARYFNDETALISGDLPFASLAVALGSICVSYDNKSIAPELLSLNFPGRAPDEFYT